MAFMKGMTSNWKALLLGGVLLGGAVGYATPSAAQQGDGEEDEQETRQAETLDPRVARDLMAAYEDLGEDKFQEGLKKLNALIRGMADAMKPFDLATVLQIRGSAYVNLDRPDEALRDFARALELDALPEEQNTQLRFNVAQLYFQAEDYAQSIRHLKQWISEVDDPTHNAYYMLAAAHYYREEHREAVPYAERTLALAPEPTKRHYDLANILYSQLEQNRKRAQLLERIVTHWPAEKQYWKQLASLYNNMGEQEKSFSTLEIAYENGLIDEESDIVSLAQYYSLFDNPHRGAELLEEEMAADNVERDVENLELLSQLWGQAREHRRAIPALEEAADLSDDGELSYRLGQVLLSDEQNVEAEQALEMAINKGGLQDKDRADAWLLLGTARFNQAGPGDQSKRAEADEAFRSAQRFATTRQQAGEWRGYISAINATERRQAALEDDQSRKLAEAARDRSITSCQAQRLSGTGLSEECEELLAEDGLDDSNGEGNANEAGDKEAGDDGADSSP